MRTHLKIQSRVRDFTSEERVVLLHTIFKVEDPDEFFSSTFMYEEHAFFLQTTAHDINIFVWDPTTWNGSHQAHVYVDPVVLKVAQMWHKNGTTAVTLAEFLNEVLGLQ